MKRRVGPIRPLARINARPRTSASHSGPEEAIARLEVDLARRRTAPALHLRTPLHSAMDGGPTFVSAFEEDCRR